MILLVLMVFVLGLSSVTPRCYLFHRTFRCNGTDVDFLKAFYKFLPDDSLAEYIHFLDGQWTVIEYFPNRRKGLQTLSIRNSSVQQIFERAFEDITILETLDLSSNILVDIAFVKFLPSQLQKLRLNDNKISVIKQVFEHFQRLEVLEMSGNQISILDFSKISKISRIDFSRNIIATFKKPEHRIQYSAINLSLNNFSEYDEDELSLSSLSLDLSHNYLLSVCLDYREMNYLNIINTSLHYLAHKINIGNLIISSNESEIVNYLIDFDTLVIKNSGIPMLSKESLNIMKSLHQIPERNMSTIDLSYSSITDISVDYFQYIRIKTLNLSYNQIKFLRSNMFLNSVLDYIDFSHSNIENLRPGVFNGVDIGSIDLRFNKIFSIKNIFRNVNIRSINLSFNEIRVIEKYSFVNCSAMSEISLSQNGIEMIEIESFINIHSLMTLDLSYNRLLILEKNTFNALPIKTLKLQGNLIKTIRTKAFNNLPHLSDLNLSDLKINNLEIHAFFDLPSAKLVDLRNNEISVIPPNLFENMKNLTIIELSGNNLILLNKFSNEIKINKLSLSYDGSLSANTISNIHINHLSIEKSSIRVLENDSLKGLYNLRELYFSQSDVFFIDSGALNDLFNLEFLDSRNLFKYTKHILKNTFADLRSLKVIDLSGLILEKIDGNSFNGLKKLKYLKMDHNHLINIYRDVFNGLDDLEILDLSYNGIINVDEGVFEALSILKELNLGYNSLNELSSGMFVGLEYLEFLSLQNNNIFSIAGDALAGLVNLRELFLQNNNISKIPIGSLRYLSNLKMFNLSNNHIEYFEDGVFSNIKSLEILDLSNTSLIRLEEVSIFFSMMDLKKLYLDRNHLKKFDMARLLANLKKIIYVGISHNKWKCNILSVIIEIMNNKNISYQTSEPIYNSHNIDGIKCFDICDFVYCSPQIEEPNHDQ